MKQIAILLCIFWSPFAFCGLAPETKAENAPLIAAITSFKWSWEEVASGVKKIEEIDFLRGGVAENPTLLWTARWEAANPRVLVLESVTRRGGVRFVGHKAYLVFDAAFTHFVGFDFNGKTTVEGFRGEEVNPKKHPTETQ